MDIVEAFHNRKSIRGYLSKPVPKETIKKIIETAVRCPSAVNTQPWEFTVVGGEVLDNIRRGNLEALSSGKTPTTEIPSENYKNIYRQRQIDLAVQIFRHMQIERSDKEKRNQWLQKGFRFFDAPAAIIISIDKSLLGTWAAFDVGAVSHGICLVALKYGLGTCIESQGIMFPDVIRRYTNTPESKLNIISIAIGYPDPNSPANKLQSKREAIENIVDWHGC